LAGSAGNKFLVKYLFQQLLEMKTFTPSSKTLLFFWCSMLGNKKTTRHN